MAHRCWGGNLENYLEGDNLNNLNNYTLTKLAQMELYIFQKISDIRV